MSNHSLSHETREALGNIKAYLSGENEAVQYAFSFLADMVTQSPSVMLGGIPAGSVPPNGIVTDSNGKVFAIDPAITATFAGSISLNLNTGEFQASWTIQQTTSSITGYVRSVEVLKAPPNDRFMFVIPQNNAGFFALTTTNI
jgi:hypothetical protein